jgi:hypothetical protein
VYKVYEQDVNLLEGIGEAELIVGISFSRVQFAEKVKSSGILLIFGPT